MSRDERHPAEQQQRPHAVHSRQDIRLAPLLRYLSCQNVALLLELLLCEQKARGRTAARSADTSSPPSGQILLLSNSLTPRALTVDLLVSEQLRLAGLPNA
jgi:hypothetical protein